MFKLAIHKDFSKVVKIRKALSILLALVGIGTLFSSAYFKLYEVDGVGHAQSFIQGFYSGGGLGLLIAGILNFIKNRKLQINEDAFRKAETIYHDERNHFILNKTGFYVCVTMFFLLYVASIIAGFIFPFLFITLLSVLGLQAILFVSIYVMMQRSV